MDMARTCEDYVVTRLVNLEEDYDKLAYDRDVAVFERDEARSLLQGLLAAIEYYGGSERYELSAYKEYDERTFRFVERCYEAANKWDAEKARTVNAEEERDE